MVGDFVESAGEWADNGTPLSSGTASVSYWSSDSLGQRTYLQSNGTMTTTPYSFPLAPTATPGEWRRAFTVPSSMGGKVIHEEIRHNDSQREAYEFEHRVTTTSSGGGGGGGNDGAHVQGA